MSVTSSDLALLARDLALNTREWVTDFVGKSVSGVADRFQAIEQQIAAAKAMVTPGPAGERGETGPEGPPGRDGQNADHDALMAELTAAIALMKTDVISLLREDLAKHVATLRVPADGRDGRDADLSLVKEWIAARPAPVLPDVEGLVQTAVTKAVAGLTLPRDGVDGKDGAPGAAGRDGIDGKDGAPGAAGRDGVDGKDGAPGLAGKDGRDGLPGVPGPQGEKGLDGKDGLNGKDGVAGLNGKDGTTFEGFGLLFDEVTGLRMQLKQGDQSLDSPIPTPVDFGVWRVGKHYPWGAEVSWNGSLWIAQKDTHGEKPGDGSGVWRLAVKAGRDAKPPRE